MGETKTRFFRDFGKKKAQRSQNVCVVEYRNIPGPAVSSVESKPRVPSMDQKTIKIPNPKCRLYCCLIKFIDWGYSQSCW